jgi:hypothetical protein
VSLPPPSKKRHCGRDRRQWEEPGDARRMVALTRPSQRATGSGSMERCEYGTVRKVLMGGCAAARPF